MRYDIYIYIYVVRRQRVKECFLVIVLELLRNDYVTILDLFILNFHFF